MPSIEVFLPIGQYSHCLWPYLGLEVGHFAYFARNGVGIMSRGVKAPMPVH